MPPQSSSLRIHIALAWIICISVGIAIEAILVWLAKLNGNGIRSTLSASASAPISHTGTTTHRHLQVVQEEPFEESTECDKQVEIINKSFSDAMEATTTNGQALTRNLFAKIFHLFHDIHSSDKQCDLKQLQSMEFKCGNDFWIQLTHETQNLSEFDFSSASASAAVVSADGSRTLSASAPPHHHHHHYSHAIITNNDCTSSAKLKKVKIKIIQTSALEVPVVIGKLVMMLTLTKTKNHNHQPPERKLQVPTNSTINQKSCLNFQFISEKSSFPLGYFYDERKGLGLVYDYDDNDDDDDHQTLSQALGTGNKRNPNSPKKIAWSDVVITSLLYQLASALASLHKCGIVHLGLSPDNSVFVEGGNHKGEYQIKLGGFEWSMLKISSRQQDLFWWCSGAGRENQYLQDDSLTTYASQEQITTMMNKQLSILTLIPTEEQHLLKSRDTFSWALIANLIMNQRPTNSSASAAAGVWSKSRFPPPNNKTSKSSNKNKHAKLRALIPLVEQCWHPEPTERPSMDLVVEMMEQTMMNVRMMMEAKEGR